MELIV